MLYQKTFKNKKIIVTGHTGFKGSWLCSWLIKLGAKVIGFSDKVPLGNSHFKYQSLNKRMKNFKVDIRNKKKLENLIYKEKPEYIFHLAAQALVKKSYQYPQLTFESNSFGTLNLLEALKNYNKKCTVIIITSDKVYKNQESKLGYKENSILGGVDPYSASKASAEIIIESYIKSFFSNKKNKVSISIARAGNVIGGGDWAKDRLIPDCVKAWSKNKKVFLRNPSSTRPWQHVLEAIWGYIVLAKKLNQNKKFHGEAFNFGPPLKNNYSVKKIVQLMEKNWKNVRWEIKKNKRNIHETNILKLNSNKSLKFLNWRSCLKIEETMKLVSQWYKNYYSTRKNYDFTFQQIDYFEKILKRRIFKK